MEEWHAITSGVQVPDLRRTFAGMFGYILTVLVDPSTVDQLAAPFLDLLGVGEEDKQFVLEDFLPAIRNASSHRYLGLRWVGLGFLGQGQDRAGHQHPRHRRQAPLRVCLAGGRD